MTKQYSNDSISTLRGADRVRLRPGVIFGSDGLEGCEHTFFEILSNAIDEAREGYGNEIEVTAYLDHSLQVQDYGRGIPIEYNEREKRYNWDLIFCELYAGGKFKNNDKQTIYKFSLGLNGLGTCATQYASSFMEVTVVRDGKEYFLRFEHGENTTVAPGYSTKKTKNPTGTRIHWLPDLQVFTDIDIPYEHLKDTVKRQAIVNSGIRFIFRAETQPNKFEETIFFYEDGMIDSIRESLGGSEPISVIRKIEKETTGQDRDDQEPYSLKMSCAYCFSAGISSIEHYHNSSWLEHGGAPDKALKSAFVSAIDSYIRTAGKYTKNEAPIAVQDVFDSLIFISNNFSTKTSYENQTKKAITNKFIREAMTDFLKENLLVVLTENRIEAEKVVSQILTNKRSRELAERSKISIKKKLTGTIGLENRIPKFVDCRTKDVAKRELYIVEGDSALGSCKQGRDSEFQAIMPVRGKILNCLKADLPAIFKSDIITDLIKIFGCGVEVNLKGSKGIPPFQLKNLRWNKIIICTDADVDGYQIRTLILTMLYKLTPTLIRAGFVYIAESPLYEITTKTENLFAFDEKEKTTILKKTKGVTKIQRSKGLGENNPEMMWETTMSPSTRRLIQVVSHQKESETKKTFETLLGKDLASRKQMITDHGEEYIDQLDI